MKEHVMTIRIVCLVILVALACGPDNSIRTLKTVSAASSIPSKNLTVESELILPVAQGAGFIAVDGENLKGRIDGAIRLGRATAGRFWTAYSFDVRPGISVDYDWNGRGNSFDGTNISFDSARETRNLGVF